MSEYKRLTKQKWSNDIDLTQELGYSYIYERLHELEDKLENGTLIDLPCVAYNVKECRYQIISAKNGRVYVSKFYRDRKEAEAQLKELDNSYKGNGEF